MNAPRRRSTALANAAKSTASDWSEVPNAHAVLDKSCAMSARRRRSAALAIAAFEAGIRRFLVAGGETSGAVAQALGLSRLDIGTEIAPGVPWTFSRVRGEDIAMTLKSGNFGDGDFFVAALARLEE